MVLLELFSGIGGFAKGFQEAGFKFNKHYFSEVDKYAVANYKYNFKNSIHVGSVTTLRGSEIERPDILTFGSPCQDFSMAGSRTGLKGKKSHLIQEAIRIITETRPSIFIWENVKGAFSSNDGADFWAIITAFTNIGGYRLEWQLVNTSWVLPQNRERIYLVGHLDKRSKPGIFPFSEDDFLVNKTRSKEEKRLESANCIAGTQSGMNPSDNFVRANCLGLSEAKMNLETNYVKITSATKSGYELANEGDGIRIDHIVETPTGRGRVSKKRSHTFDRTGTQAVLIEGEIRVLTEIERERLQGFPDDWTKYGIFDGEVKEISKSQRKKLTGNAVSVPIVKMIVKRINI